MWITLKLTGVHVHVCATVFGKTKKKMPQRAVAEVEQVHNYYSQTSSGG